MCCNFSNLLGCDCGGLTVPDFIVDSHHESCNIVGGTNSDSCGCNGSVGGTNTCNCCNNCPCRFCCGCCGAVGGTGTDSCECANTCEREEECGCRNNGVVGGIVAGTTCHRHGCRRCRG